MSAFGGDDLLPAPHEIGKLLQTLTDAFKICELRKSLEYLQIGHFIEVELGLTGEDAMLGV